MNSPSTIKNGLVLLFVLPALGALAQDLSSISGTVVDAQTKKSLPGAVVYLAHTSIGTMANADGSFSLEKIPTGKYNLIVSMLGYATLSSPRQFPGGDKTVALSLEPVASLLDSVVVVGKKSKTRHSDFATFVKFFVGQTSNARACRIVNPQSIIAYTENGKVIANASEPIVIENEALGYRVHFDLKEFVYDPLIGEVVTAGTPRFEELHTDNPKQARQWARERDRAYYGSSRHLLLSIKNRALAENHFTVTDAGNVVLSETDLKKGDLLFRQNRIFVSFDELPEIYFPTRYKTNRQLSTVIFRAPIMVYDNGYFENFENIIFQGYIGWNSVIADLVPLGYQPQK